MNKAEVRFPGGKIYAEVADSMVKRSVGLSFRGAMKGDEGMMFLLSFPCRPVFWNFGMRFPIDVVWMRGSLVVGIEERIPPMKKGIRIFSSRDKADSVLELSAGTVGRLGIKPCDNIDIVFTP